MSRLLISLMAGAGIALAGVAGAANITRDAYSAEKERIEAAYKADKAACKDLKGNAKDVCIEQAKAKEKIARADNEAAYKGTEKARYDARVARAEAEYAVAKEKCDDLAGNDKDVCRKEAKAAEVKAKADAKVAHVSTQATHTASMKREEARKDAAEDKRDAEYKVAVEKCDAMSGSAKTACMNEAKALYGKS